MLDDSRLGNGFVAAAVHIRGVKDEATKDALESLWQLIWANAPESANRPKESLDQLMREIPAHIGGAHGVPYVKPAGPLPPPVRP